MSDFSEARMDQFVRTYPYPFTAEAFCEFMAEIGEKMSNADCRDYLLVNPYVFKLRDNVFLTRAGFALGKKFSIKPTLEEIKKGIFVVGDRCVPFANPEIVSSTFTFLWNGMPLASKVCEFSKNSAVEFFRLFGDEYASQYIAADFANKDINLTQNDFELPYTVSLTGVSLEPLINDLGFQYGDRLLCEVEDWNSGVFKITPILRHENNFQIAEDDVKRQEWYDSLEKILLTALEYVGPMTSIDEQLANSIVEFNDFLSEDWCGSIEEFVQQSKKIGFENYGVETRLWYKGHDVPAVGKWTATCDGFTFLVPEEYFPNLPFLVDTCVKDCLFSKIKIESGDFSVLEMILNTMEFSKRQVNQIDKMIETRKKFVVQNYNWFADQGIGEVRHAAFDFYKKVFRLLFNIENASVDDLQQMPQEELIVLTQLFIQTVKILEGVEEQQDYIASESDVILRSICTMEENFEEISPLLSSSIAKIKSKQFKLIK